MAPPKLSLPASMLKELDYQPQASRQGGRHRSLSRKDERKAARVTKRHRQSAQLRRANDRSLQETKPSKQIKPIPRQVPVQHESDDLEDETGFESEDGHESDLDGLDHEDASESDSSEADDEPAPSKSGQRSLAQEDKEIAALEKKLGMKGKKKLPKSFDDDGLGQLLEGLDDEDGEDASGRSTSKRKRDLVADEWLTQKRRKAEAAAAAVAAAEPYTSDTGEPDLDSSEGGEEDGEDEDEDEDEDDNTSANSDFDGFSDMDDVEPEARPQRENPYVAPTTNVAKYVPPSLRKSASSGNDAEAQLRRRVQGLINRLTNDNMVGILKDFMAIYEQNARQTITSILVDLVLNLVCSPEKRPDAFFTMIAGFIAAIHRAMGMSVSAYFVQQLTDMFAKRHEAATGDQSDAACKHLMALVAELYNMQVIGCKLVYDYIRLFLETLSELNTELLLRIIQLCGPSLRRDDPRALDDIVSRVKSGDMRAMSVRTSFMIDEMRKLQSNKKKAAARNKHLADQRAQIRKRISSLGGSRNAQPLNIGLDDIQKADEQGKWWLVGASWSGNSKPDAASGRHGELAKQNEAIAEKQEHGNNGWEGLFPDDFPDLWQMAREQGFNTDVRQRIFVALHQATDNNNAGPLLRRLQLNKHQRKEIPEVIVRSGERQEQYNPYYTLVASQFTSDKIMWFEFRRCLATRFRKMGEEMDMHGDDDDDEADEEEMTPMEIHNVAKMFGSLVVSRHIKLEVIIKHRNLLALQEKTQLFMEVLFINVLLEGKGQKGLKEILLGLGSAGLDVQAFLRRYVRDTNLTKVPKKKERLRRRCDFAIGVLDSLVP
ncbi:hypothetical protein GGR56DRAFT_644607 [Xylariaceae sp. FL0804]|nr:hypothetical protein GGR56DRAFT_644607 [Xylariaceae sp. FL0804]